MFRTLMCLLLFWGLVSAASICVYTLQPIELLKKYGTTSIVGFAMFICGILSLAMFQQVESEALWDGMTWLGLFAIIILGTVVSFNAYMEGLHSLVLYRLYTFIIRTNLSSNLWMGIAEGIVLRWSVFLA